MGSRGVQALVVVFVLLVFALAATVWFSHSELVEGVVTSKWSETTTSCDDDGCTSSNNHLFQMQDGNIYSCFWGNRDYDRIHVGDRIRFVARGYTIRIFGWRLATPSIFRFEEVKDG